MARRGRPRIETGTEAAHEEPENELSNRRLRMRLAQRAYRNRKMMALDNETARAEKLSVGLHKAVAAFTTFHQQIDRDQLPPHVLVHLNKVADEMAAVTRDIQGDLPFSEAPVHSSLSSPQPFRDNWQPKPALPRTLPEPRPVDELNLLLGSLPISFPGQASIQRQEAVSLSLWSRNPGQESLENRIIRACIEHAIFLLSDKNHQYRLPALSIPLKLLGEEVFMTSSLGLRSAFVGNLRDYQYPPFAIAYLPTMLRVVEGSSMGEPRLQTPFVQRLQFGRTRTILRTDDPALQGEWMEALDVEEYLQERGIDLKNIAPSAGLEENHDTTSSSGTVQGMIQQGRQIAIPQQFDQPGASGSQVFPITYQIHEVADFSVFGIRTDDQTSTIRGSTPTNVIGAVPTILARETQAHRPQGIIIDVDQLTQILGASAMCLGPIPGIRRESVDDAIRQSIMKLETPGQTAMN
ncbi:hypothetical protein B0T10DRAFT_438352 [Thelonectria olida]|uniref:BZIP domain-containing protein n=1 Tax=Thelonectria olida TaxID=1576542 RepID=A0A9P8W8W7_9HYPO|nr:hypothetical protein B0T10DRAFT_438352 [Thelonectria olida]